MELQGCGFFSWYLGLQTLENSAPRWRKQVDLCPTNAECGFDGCFDDFFPFFRVQFIFTHREGNHRGVWSQNVRIDPGRGHFLMTQVVKATSQYKGFTNHNDQAQLWPTHPEISWIDGQAKQQIEHCQANTLLSPGE